MILNSLMNLERVQMNKLAVIALTEGGIGLGDQLFIKSKGQVDRYTLKKYARQGWNSDSSSLTQLVEKVFHEYSGMIMIMAVGIVVRTIGPLLKSKITDPAVVVMDEKGQFAISLLSGHLGGANQLATEIASLLGCQRVITTGTDVNQLIAIDTLAKSWDMTLEPVKKIKIFNKALLEGKEYKFWIDKGYFLGIDFSPQPLEEYSPNCAYNVFITHRIIPELNDKDKGIFLRPKNLILGIGCRKGVPFEEMWSALEDFLAVNKLSINSIGKIATISLKGKEKAILKLAEKLKCQLVTYSKNEIANCFQQYSYLKTSKFVQEKVEVPGVCEPAALLASSNHQLLVPKSKYQGITFSVAVLKDYNIKNSFSWFKEEKDL